MIYFILGFLSWPFIGFIYIKLKNFYYYFRKAHPMMYHNLWESFLGPVNIVLELRNWFRGISKDINPPSQKIF